MSPDPSIGLTLHFTSNAGLVFPSLSAVGAIGFLLFGAPVHLWRRNKARIRDFEDRLTPKLGINVGDEKPFVYLQTEYAGGYINEFDLTKLGKRYLHLRIANRSDAPLSLVKVRIESIEHYAQTVPIGHTLRRRENNNETFNLRPREKKEVAFALGYETEQPPKIWLGYHHRTQEYAEELTDAGCVAFVRVMANECPPHDERIRLHFVDGRLTASKVD